MVGTGLLPNAVYARSPHHRILRCMSESWQYGLHDLLVVQQQQPVPVDSEKYPYSSGTICIQRKMPARKLCESSSPARFCLCALRTRVDEIDPGWLHKSKQAKRFDAGVYSATGKLCCV